MRAETKQMEYRQFGKRLLAAASITAVALGIGSCGASNTVDFLYVTSNLQNPGQINVFVVDSLSGALKQIPDSPYQSGGRNPVYEVASPDGKNLYVANHDDNTIVRFAIGTDGKLYPLQTINTPGTEPVALAINSAGTALYVLDYYAPSAPGQPSYTDLNPGPGAVVVLPVDSTGHLGAPLTSGTADYWAVQCFPSNLALTPNGNNLYVTNTNAVVVTTSPPVTGTVPTLPASCPSSGTVSAFAVASTSGGSTPTVSGLTPIGAAPITTGAGSEPTGIAADPSNGSVYVLDSALNKVDDFTIQADGSLSLLTSVPSGTMPMGATVVTNAQSSNKYLYVTNYADGSISSYLLNSGVPALIASTNSGASGPLCVMADPNLTRFVYTADYIGGKVGGAELDPNSGKLIINQNSPYSTAGQPTCVAAITHNGNSNGLK